MQFTGGFESQSLSYALPPFGHIYGSVSAIVTTGSLLTNIDIETHNDGKHYIPLATITGASVMINPDQL